MRRWFLTGLLVATFVAVAQYLPAFKPVTQPTAQKADVRQPPSPPLSESSLSVPSNTPVFDDLEHTAQDNETQSPAGPLVLTQALDKALISTGQLNERYLVIEVHAPESIEAERQPVHIALLMDTSGSMSSEGKLNHARMAAAELLNQLQEGDTFSLVTFSDRATVVIPTTSLSGVAMAHRALSGISPEGGTNLFDGIQAGLHQLETIDSPGTRRLVLLSDGMANIGQTNPMALARAASNLVSDGISVSGIGLGLDYNEDTLTKISDAGGGRYHFVDRPGQLSEVFASEFQQMATVVAQQTSVLLETAPSTEVLEIFGYPVSQSRDGHHVFLGDVHAGETRKVVAHIQVKGSDQTEVAVSSTHLKYATPASANQPTSSFHQVEELVATLSNEPALVERSTVPSATISGVQAHAGWFLDKGARAWESGDRTTHRVMLSKGQSLLRTAAETHQSPSLALEADQLHAHSHVFDTADVESDAGLYQVKKAKENARAYAH